MGTVVAKIPIECPNNYEPVSVRRLEGGEQYVGPNGEVLTATSAVSKFTSPVLIVRPKFEWPVNITAKALSKDSSHNIWIHPDRIPRLDYRRWYSLEMVRANSFLDVDIPGPWEDSLRINPLLKDEVPSVEGRTIISARDAIRTRRSLDRAGWYEAVGGFATISVQGDPKSDALVNHIKAIEEFTKESLFYRRKHLVGGWLDHTTMVWLAIDPIIDAPSD